MTKKNILNNTVKNFFNYEDVTRSSLYTKKANKFQYLAAIRKELMFEEGEVICCYLDELISAKRRKFSLKFIQVKV